MMAALDPVTFESVFLSGFETPAENGTITNFAEMSQARDKILSLKLDQVGTASFTSTLEVLAYAHLGIRNSNLDRPADGNRPQRLPHFAR